MKRTPANEVPGGKALLCHAEGAGGEWEAFCVDLDLAVQGRSFNEVYQKLLDQIHLYLESVSELPEVDRQRLLRRTAPLAARLPLIIGMLWSEISHRGGKRRHEYSMPVKELAAPACSREMSFASHEP